jgi:outer membrane lipoprotein-sorting protein
MSLRVRGIVIGALILAGCGRTVAEEPAAVDASVGPVTQAVASPIEPMPRPVGAAVDARAEEILKNADEVRNPQFDYTVVVTVTTAKPNASSTTSVYEVLVKGREKAVVKTLEPPIEKGRVLLMLGHDLWAFLPDVSKPLRISFQERLTGEVANGDLARANFSGDYTPELLRVESQGPATYDVLNLTAVSDDVTYARVELWVEHGTFHPHRAEFYAVSGRLLKTCSYERYQELGGRLRPTRLVMRNPLINGQYSVLEYDRMRLEELPDKYFTKDYMKRLVE